jgi:sigma-B regulation protein RsbU (phosphoserine phosphatase)
VSGAAVTRFGRGRDRRVASTRVAYERRRGERRKPDLEWVPLFKGADPRELAAVLAECEVLTLTAGAALLRAGEANASVYVLLSGRLVAQLGPAASPEASVAIDIQPGECIGELSAIDGKPISAQVLAESDVRVLRLEREVFWNRLMRQHGVAENLMMTLTARMRRASEKTLALQRELLELEHLKKELDLARQIQASMLPLQRPLFPGRPGIEACGFMEPAEKIGGDLFDAFFVDQHTLFVCIGDVSGHGIAAALFMVRVIGLLRTLAMETADPGQVLETLNDRLCVGNDASIFVTLFCGFLDVQAGEFVYSNGGHPMPIVASAREASLLPLPKGALLGASSGRHYASLRRTLAVGETLFCYTDGVTEAESPTGAQFSVERCLKRLRAGAHCALPELLDDLHAQVVGHTGSPALADDCTMLAVRRTWEYQRK